MPETDEIDSRSGPRAATGLVDAIRALRRELADAQSEGNQGDIRFRLGPVEMEFLVEVSDEGKGEAGIRFWVVNVGGAATVSRGTTQRLTLTLHPYDARSGADVDVSSRDEDGQPV